MPKWQHVRKSKANVEDARMFVEREACRGYERFYRLPAGSATLPQVAKSSAGVAGWFQFTKCLDVVAADAEHDKKLLEKQLQRDKLFHDLGTCL